MTQSYEDDLAQQYVHFCANPFRKSDEIMREYEQLKQHPRVMSIGFINSDVLLVGTDSIVITHNKQNHLIGEFIILLVRKNIGGYYKSNFLFRNITHIIEKIKPNDDESPDVYYLHPHIVCLPGKKELVENSYGRLCISTGQFSVYQHIRKGEMHLVVPLLIKILEVYTTGNEYCPLEQWPLVGEKNA